MHRADPFEHLGGTARMGSVLRHEVERQLLEDLKFYGVSVSDLAFDWSGSCQEGHCTEALDGNLESLSGVVVVDRNLSPVAEGWMDFVHGGQGNPLHVFWLFLSVKRESAWDDVKSDQGLPRHIWARLSPVSKRACAHRNGYDARWSSHEVVQEWVRASEA